jgi:hypothetical protein
MFTSQDRERLISIEKLYREILAGLQIKERLERIEADGKHILAQVTRTDATAAEEAEMARRVKEQADKLRAANAPPEK